MGIPIFALAVACPVVSLGSSGFIEGRENE